LTSLNNPAGLPSSTIDWRRRNRMGSTTEMEKENPQRLLGAHQKRGFHRQQGLEVK
jgi:hypothetical protein